MTVDQVLVNGNLHVVGEKQIAINQGTELFASLAWLIHALSAAAIPYHLLRWPDARIEYVGNGYINEAQNMGWLQRFFLNLSPM